MMMDSLTAPDSDVCGDCGYDPCNCHVEVARRLCQTHEPKGLAANLQSSAHFERSREAAPLVTRAPDREPRHTTGEPVPHSRFGVPIGGLQFSLARAVEGYAELQPGLAAIDPAAAARLDFLFDTYVRAALDDLANLRRDTRDLRFNQGERP